MIISHDLGQLNEDSLHKTSAMETKLGFTKMSVSEFETWLNSLRIARTVLKIQLHHTYRPDYSNFTGSNHFERQQAMKNHHMLNNGWSDIGQHFTIFPDGSLMTGRSLENIPACIYGQNSNSVCIENLGNFDHGGDIMTQAQKDAIVMVTSMLLRKFNLPPNSNTILYHHWFDLSTGQRNHSNRNKKSCPGSNFFGGNKEQDFETNFLPLIVSSLTGSVIKENTATVVRFACVTATTLNIRIQPDSSASKAPDRDPVTFGTILRIYDEQNGWLKISNSQPHWVSGRFTTPVTRATVTAGSLNIRTGPGTEFFKAGNYTQGEIVFIFEEKNGWARVSLSDRWVSSRYLDTEN